MSIMVSEVLQEVKDKSEYVFCNLETDEPYHSIKTSFGKALKRAGLEGVRFHDLRHTSATFMVTGGTDLATVKEILGHASIEMTMRYTHPTTEGKMGAVNAVANQMVGTDKHHSSTEAKITTLRKAVNRSVN